MTITYEMINPTASASGVYEGLVKLVSWDGNGKCRAMFCGDYRKILRIQLVDNVIL